ncbi:hypothetical protein M408DRAFT_26236 [Serendipita vermifera MAFF 305830]|uniref:Uncharacterized protein n=1 Tax=Serendipita vermifera MAFF 305830 TaxID=933852 RepID=A0A0C2WGB9_SERVB|nr:hypothetical protein M408DRAFT_26236 [Serendipita vermifera MAFF 305830]
MSRLASFQGPSTPSKNPVNTSEYAPLSPSSKGKKSSKSRQNPRPASDQPPEPPSSPSTPTRKNRPAASSPVPITAHEQSFDFVESTVHKRLRQTLLEVRGVTKRWDELTKVDGFKAAKEIIDARTLIDNALATVPKGRLPSKVVVGPNMKVINDSISKLEAMISNLRLLLVRMTALVDSLDAIYTQATNDFYSLSSSAPHPVATLLNPDSPLWPETTWSLSQFCAIVPLLIPGFYHRSLIWHQSTVKLISNPTLKWEQARTLLTSWKDGDHWTESITSQETGRTICFNGIVLDCGWSTDFEDICAVEIHGWK